MAEVATSMERLSHQLTNGTKCYQGSSGTHVISSGGELNATKENSYVEFTNGYQQSSTDSDSDDSSDVSDDNEEESVLQDISSKENCVEDSTLNQWVLNTFVPVCASLLDHCGDENVIASVVQADLTELSNILQKFCDQHQSRGSSSTSSTTASAAAPLSPAISSSLLRCKTFNFSEQLTPLADGCMSVKVLRSAATSLIPPLLTEISQKYSFSLCAKIVDTLRKLILQVEAFVSFLNPNKDLNIYGEIFTEQRKLQLNRFIVATPPPVYKVHSLSRGVRPANDKPAVRLSGSNIVSVAQPISITELEQDDDNDGDDDDDDDVGPDPKVIQPNILSHSLDTGCSKLFSHMTFSMEYSDADAEQPVYVRPNNMRRTTVSLSHKEVAHLFLDNRRRSSITVAPNPTAASLIDSTKGSLHLSPILRRKSETVDDHGERLRKLHQALLKGFERQVLVSSSDETCEDSAVKKDVPSTLDIKTVTTGAATPTVDTANADREDCSSRNSTFSSSGSRSSGAYDNSEIPKAPSPENVKSPRQNTSPVSHSNSAPTTPIRLFKKTVQRVVSHSFEYSAKRSPNRKKSRKSYRPTSTFFDVADLADENQMVISVELGKKRASFSKFLYIVFSFDKCVNFLEDDSKAPFEISVVTNMHQVII